MRKNLNSATYLVTHVVQFVVKSFFFVGVFISCYSLLISLFMIVEMIQGHVKMSFSMYFSGGTSTIFSSIGFHKFCWWGHTPPACLKFSLWNENCYW